MGLKKGQRHRGQFKKGNPGGPGRTRLDVDILEIRKSAREELCAWYAHFVKLSPEQRRNLKPSEYPLLASGILKSLQKFARSGHWKQIEYLVNQVIGKPRESLELTGKDGGPVEVQHWKDLIKKKMGDHADSNG